MSIAVVNYGMGNLGSVSRALSKLGLDARIADSPGQLEHADRIILPGVGSFADGVTSLRRNGWFDALQRHAHEGRPLLGICLGMQMLASSGSEWGEHEGLGLIPGRVTRLDELGCTERIPHVGWNNLRLRSSRDAVVAGIPDSTDFYFVHSFAFNPDVAHHIVATTDYGVTFPAIVRSENVVGAQFHPEKSSRAGLRILENFAGIPPC